MFIPRKAIVAITAAVVLLGLLVRPAPAQSSGDPALRAEMQAMRQAINDLVAVMRKWMDESAKREFANLTIRRIDLAERQAAAIEDELRNQRTQLAQHEKTMLAGRGLIESSRQMSQMDKAGAAREILQNEATRGASEEAKGQQLMAMTQQRIQELEIELAAKRGLIKDLEAQLAREGAIK